MPRLSVPGAYLHLKGQKKSSSSIILTEEQSFDSGAATSSSLNDNGQISPPMPTEDPYYPDDRVYMADDAMTTTTVSGQTTVSILGEDDDDDDDERGGVSAIVDGAAVHFKTPMSCGGAATPKLSPNARCHKWVSPFWAFCFGGARSNINNNNNNNKGPFFVTMSIILMVLTLVVILMLLKSGKSSRPDFFDVNATAAPFLIKNEQICATSSCVKAASNLLQAIDFSVDPCQNFYDYACGQWNKDHPIPDDVAAYGTFAFVRDLVRQQLRGLLEQAIDDNENKPIRMAKVYYRMCMNTTQINNAGLDPILKPLKELGGWPLLDENFNASTIDLTQLLANLRKYYSLDVFLSFYVYADSKNTTTNILNIDKGSLGLGMGTRDYYLNDTSYGSQMAAYKKFLTDLVLVFAKETKNLTKLDERIMRQIDEILDFEKKIANMTTPEDQRRNHSLLYNKWNIDQLQNHTPVIDWRTYFRLITSDEVYKIFRKPDFTVIVNEPTFMQNLNDLLQNTDKRIVVNYIIWRFLKMWSKILDSRFDDIFQDFAQVMLGRQQKPVRWKHCVPSTVSTFDMAVGALYVKQHFKHEDKEEALSMIKHLQTAFRQLVSKLDWMDEQTKKVAIEKAQAMLNHIGYPEFILNNTALNEYYADLDIMSQPMTFFEMNRKYSLWAQNKDFSELTKPFDRNKFDTSPAIVNAFYSPEKNAITFPAGILQPPFFKGDYPKAINYGAMGAVIGHEITHGFDDQGCQYDRNGNLNDWWTPLAFDGFRQRTECIVEQYNNYTVVEVKTKVNGKLTQGENIADNGGVKEAYMAYRKYLDELGTEEMRLPGLLNLTNYQIFFLSYANFWCGHKKPAAALQQVLTDPHSPEMFRVVGVLSNMDEFAQAFQCPAGSPMNPLPSQRPKCRVW